MLHSSSFEMGLRLLSNCFFFSKRRVVGGGFVVFTEDCSFFPFPSSGELGDEFVCKSDSTLSFEYYQSYGIERRRK